MSDQDEWARHLKMILDATADVSRMLASSDGATAYSGEATMPRVVALVRDANAIAARLGESTLTVPGEAPVVDLRPWWSRLLDFVSRTARQNTVGQQLETLRLEADVALLRTGPRG